MPKTLPEFHPLSALLDRFCPMHAMLGPTGHIVHAGPTFRKIAGGGEPAGRRFLEVFELRRPCGASNMADLKRLSGRKLYLRLRSSPGIEIKGMLAALDEAAGGGPPGGAIVDLSFGIHVMEAVRRFDLTGRDFSATDLAVEMLYLHEAKSLAMRSSQQLNLRLQEARLQAEQDAFTDTLTGLGNRRALEWILARLGESGLDYALVQMDLDRFKAINDTMGHAAGDHVLREVAGRLKECVRSQDEIVRMGGDEFMLVLNEVTASRAVADIARRLLARLEQPIPYAGRECCISASLGAVLTVDYAPPCPARLIQDADAALYKAKGKGGARLVHFMAPD